MAGTVSGNSLSFNIHSLVKIKAEGLVPERDPSPFHVIKHDGGFIIVFGNIRKPDILIRLSDAIELFYAPKKGCAWRIFDCLVLCIQLALQKKGGMLFHGSVMNQGDRTLLLIGPGGIGKSIFVLNMIENGWNYLSEDKFVLFNGKAYIFRDYIPLTDYHFDIFSWLHGIKSLDKNVLRHAALRKRFKKLAESYRRFYAVTIPFAENPDNLYKDFKECLSRVS